MYKLARWIYKLGVAHERRRVKLLIEQSRPNKPERPREDDTLPNSERRRNEENYQRQMAVWREVQNTLGRLTEPRYTSHVEERLTPLDEDIG